MVVRIAEGSRIGREVAVEVPREKAALERESLRVAEPLADQMADALPPKTETPLTAHPMLRSRAGVSLRRSATASEVPLADILAVAAAPSSQRIEGFRSAHFDIAKAANTRQMEAHPDMPMHMMLDPLADIGPSLSKIPRLVPAIERVCRRFANGGMKTNIREIATLPTQIQDYVIIGAGMGGTAAGAIFADANRAGANLKGLVLEGGTQIGGRARDIDVNGHKAGLGPSWLHGKYNMLRRAADMLGLTRQRTYLDREVYIDGRKATSKESEEFFKAEEAAEAAQHAAVKNGKESAGNAASKFYPAGRFKAVAEAELGRGDQGASISKVDAIDASYFESNQDDFIKEGMQEFVTRLAKAAELPVAFNARVKSAHRDANDIWTVTLHDGRSVRTRQLIYTGSTGVLDSIDFGPHGLPVAKTQIVREALPMGNFTKALFTTKEPFERPDTYANSWVVNAQTGRTGKLYESVQFVVKYEGDKRANIMFSGGGVASRLLALPKDKSMAYVEKEFSLIAGHPVQVEHIAWTPFPDDPLFLGSYSNLLPGKEGAHTVYAAPWRGLHFAGEAAGTAQNNASLLAAFCSSIDTAYDAIAALKLPKP